MCLNVNFKKRIRKDSDIIPIRPPQNLNTTIAVVQRTGEDDQEEEKLDQKILDNPSPVSEEVDNE